MLTIIFVLVFGLLYACQGQKTISCLSCTRLANPDDCNEKVQCLQGEVCMTERYVTDQGHIFYDLGCKLASTCSNAGYIVSEAELKARIKNFKSQGQGQNLGGMVGRKRLDPFESGVVHTCEECCETEHCNNYLCGGHVSTNLKCVNCQGVASMSYCDKLETCSPHEVCYIQEIVTDRFELEYNGGCMREVQCQAFLANIKMFYGEPNSPCANCCNDSFCNNYCPVASTSTTAATTTKPTTSTTRMVTTVCPPFPIPTIKEPTKVNNTLVQLGCGKKEDIMFLVDNAAVLHNKEEYLLEIFAQSLIESMVLGPDAANVGYSYFSGNVHHVIDLDHGGTHEYVDEQLKNLERHRGIGSKDTDLAGAVRDAFYSLTGSKRPDADKTIVLMLKRYNTNTTTVQKMADLMRRNNLTVIVVAIGNFRKDEMDGLKDLASSPTNSYLFNFNQVSEMANILEDIALSKCKDRKVEVTLLPDPCSGPKLLNYLGCGAEEDVVLLLDRSSSIHLDDWKQIGRFVHEMVAKFNIAPGASRLGLISFNTTVTELIKLHEFPNRTDLLNRIDTLLKSKDQEPRGATMTGDALETTIEWYKHSNRTSAIKTAIVFTDGGSDTKFATVARALELHRMNVSVFVIGIGHEVDLKEQLIIASDPDNEHMINVKDVKGLLKYLTYLEAIRCRDLSMQSTQTTPNSTVSATRAALPAIG